MPDTRRRIPALALMTLTSVLIGACGPAAPPSVVPSASARSSLTPVPAVTASPSTSPLLSPSPSPSQAPAGVPGGQPGSQTVQPSSPSVVVGGTETITVFTHCGFAGRLDWAGSFWQESGRSPDGGPIGDPEDTGRITLLTSTTAKFVSSTGTVVALQRMPGPVELAPCD